jgi:hypothetical protein
MSGSATAGCCSCGAYPRETQEMVFDAHDRAFALFGGHLRRGIYDNMKTPWRRSSSARPGAYNRRFMQMCSHYLVEPVACTPASGWEKGQVENQVGLSATLLHAAAAVQNLDELNGWLLDKCIAYAKAHRHPRPLTADGLGGVRSRAAKARSLCVGRFDGFHAVPACLEDLPGALRQQQILGHGQRRRAAGRGSCLCRPHRYPPGRRGGRRASARFGRGETVYDPWHYVPVLARKPGALRNGAPFKDWVLPAAIDRGGASGSLGATMAIGRWSTC